MRRVGFAHRRAFGEQRSLRFGRAQIGGALREQREMRERESREVERKRERERAER